MGFDVFNPSLLKIFCFGFPDLPPNNLCNKIILFKKKKFSDYYVPHIVRHLRIKCQLEIDAERCTN